jgi:hypothetical protein
MAYKKIRGIGPEINYKTWLALWIDMKGWSVDTFARILCYSHVSVQKWRKGRIGPHAAQLIRARWPDAPVHRLGGHVPRINEPLPINARTPDLYRFMFKKMGLIGEKAICPVTLERARGIYVGKSKPKEIPMTGGEVDPDGV